MEDAWQRFVENLIGRLDGPMHLRLIIQPLMGVIFAVIDAIKDVKENRPVYTWSLVLTPWLRKELLKDGWKHFGKIFILAIILDIIYQMITVKGVYLLELLITAVVLALLPYILTRGPAARIIRLGKKLGKKE